MTTDTPLIRVSLDQSRRLGSKMKKSKYSKSSKWGKMERQRKGMMGSDVRAQSALTDAPKKPKGAKGAAASKAYLQPEAYVQPDYSYTSGEPIQTISLGNKRPEGITQSPDGNSMFVTEMLYGGVKKVDILTGEIEQIVPSYGFLERGAYGILYHNDALFVAGGGVPDGTPVMLYLYDAETGEEIAACAPVGDAYLLNDVAILGNYAYVTDSYYNKLMVVDVEAALAGSCDVFSIKLPSEYFLADPPESFPRANGRCRDLYQISLHYMVCSSTFICSLIKESFRMTKA